MISLKQILEFTKFTHKFQQVIRGVYVNGQNRNENDAEHSYQLALIAWYLISSNNLKLNLEKVIKYSLAHDLVETYAGDVDYYSGSKNEKENKQENEAKAAARIQKEFPEFAELHQIIASYEEKSDPEAKFVYALDKIVIVFNIYLDNGRSWQRDKVTYKMLRTKDPKIAQSPEIQKIWDQLTNLLENDTGNLFWKD